MVSYTKLKGRLKAKVNKFPYSLFSPQLPKWSFKNILQIVSLHCLKPPSGMQFFIEYASPILLCSLAVFLEGAKRIPTSWPLNLHMLFPLYGWLLFVKFW